jgi:hypothetical protein
LAALADKVTTEQPSARTILNILKLLPRGVSSLESHAALKGCCWEVIKSTAQRYADVHALVTSQQQLQEFRDLPYNVVLAWAKNIALTVDTEDSVAIVLDWWIRGRGWRVNKALDGLVEALRVRSMTPGRKVSRKNQERVKPTFKPSHAMTNPRMSQAIHDSMHPALASKCLCSPCSSMGLSMGCAYPLT